MMIYIIILVIFFILVRNSNKKAQRKEKNMQDSIKPGMYVMLKDGLYGTVVDVEDDTLIINFSIDGADEGCMAVLKTGVSTIVENAGNMLISGEETEYNDPDDDDTVDGSDMDDEDYTDDGADDASDNAESQEDNSFNDADDGSTEEEE